MSKKTKVIGKKSKIYTNHKAIFEFVNKERKKITESLEKEFIKIFCSSGLETKASW